MAQHGDGAQPAASVQPAAGGLCHVGPAGQTATHGHGRAAISRRTSPATGTTPRGHHARRPSRGHQARLEGTEWSCMETLFMLFERIYIMDITIT